METTPALPIPAVSRRRPIAAFAMIGAAALMVIGLFLPYVVSDIDSSLKASVFDVIGGGIEFVPSNSATVYTIIASAVGVAALFAGLSLTGNKIWGVFGLIAGLLIAAFHGLMMATVGREARSVSFGLGMTVILIGGALLFCASLAFLLRTKPRAA